MHIDTKQSRRAFLQRTAILGGAGTAAPLAASLGWISEVAAAASGTDYKALVCIYLYGGNDYANTLAPYDPASYNSYLAARPTLALAHDQLGATALKPANDLGGWQYALNPVLAPFVPLFEQGKLAPLLNVGNLVQPVTKEQYLKRSVLLPPKLFSHNDQQCYTMASQPEGAASGWGGRMGDLLRSSNGTAALTSISVNGNALFLSGKTTTPFTIGAGKIEQMLNGSRSLYGSSSAYNALTQLMTGQTGCYFGQEYANVAQRTLSIGQGIVEALAKVPEESFTTFPADGSSLSEQMRMVARLIAAAPSFGLRRQVFFVGMGGWDTHNDLAQKHPALLGTLAQAMCSFYQATVQMGVADQVTAFTASDFGRTLGANGDGSDHGWGGTQFLLGGAVQGQRIYGTPPSVGLNTNDDVNFGRLIPTTSMDQFAATLALWFGVPVSDLPLVMPNLRYFNPSTWDLGFMHA